MSADDLRGTYLSARPDVDEATRRAASLTTAARARDVADARDLLAVLGLIDAAAPASCPPLPCGHPHTALRRRLNGRRGTECADCVLAADRIRAARRRALRVKR